MLGPLPDAAQGGLEKERCWMDMLGRLALAVHVKRQEQLYSPEAGAAWVQWSCTGSAQGP